MANAKTRCNHYVSQLHSTSAYNFNMQSNFNSNRKHVTPLIRVQKVHPVWLSIIYHNFWHVLFQVNKQLWAQRTNIWPLYTTGCRWYKVRPQFLFCGYTEPCGLTTVFYSNPYWVTYVLIYTLGQVVTFKARFAR